MMILTQPDSPLHHALKNNQAHLLIVQLRQRQPLALLDQVNSHGLTALQLAASLGMIEAVLWLVYAGADIHAYQACEASDQRLVQAQKPCLYLSAESQHALLSEILLCLGANKNESLELAGTWHDEASFDTLAQLTLNSHVFQGILFWNVEHYHPTYRNQLIALLQQQISFEPTTQLSANELDEDEKKQPGLTQPLLHHPSTPIDIDEKTPLSKLRTCLFGLSELAMHRKQADLALALIALNQGLFPMNPARPTIAYWAIKQQDDTIYNALIKNNDALIILTLQQFETTGALEDYDYLFKKISASQQSLFLNAHALTNSEPTPHAHQQKIYHYASFHLTSHYTLASQGYTDDCYAVLNHALQQDDYVALALLISHFDRYDLFKRAIQNKQNQLLLHLMFRTNCYPYELSQKIPHTIAVEFNALFALLAPAERYGVLQQFIALGLKNTLRDDRNPHEIKQQKAYFHALTINTPIFLKHYGLYFDLPRATTDSTPNQVNISVECDNRLIIHAKRFGITCSQQQYISHTNDRNPLLHLLTNTTLGPAQIVFDSLDDRSRMRFFRVAKKSYQYQSYNLMQKIKFFLRALSLELQQQPYWLNRPLWIYIDRYIGYSLCLSIVLTLSALIPCVAELVAQLQDKTHVIQQMHDVINSSNPPNPCSALLDHSSVPGHNACDIVQWQNYTNSSCEPLCDELATIAAHILLYATYGITLPGLFTLVALALLSPSIYALCLGVSRFNDRPLNAFSGQLNHLAEPLFEEINAQPALADANLSTTSSIETIRSTLQKTQCRLQDYNQLHVTTNTMRFFKAAPQPLRIEEVNENPTAVSAPHASPGLG